MSFLLRVVLPDRPGMLGALATALGEAGGDILSLDVVERGPQGAVDDLLVERPPGGLADRLITSAQSIPGVVVESLRPYFGATDLRRDLDLVERLAAQPDQGLALLTEHIPGIFRAGWAAVVRPREDQLRVLACSSAAPDLRTVRAPWLPLVAAGSLDMAGSWVPEAWQRLGVQLAVAPYADGGSVVLVGRPGGPTFRASEVLRLTHLAGIAASVGVAAQGAADAALAG